MYSLYLIVALHVFIMSDCSLACIHYVWLYPRMYSLWLIVASHVFIVSDCSCHLLGGAGENLGAQFYQPPNLAASLLESMFSNVSHVPDYRLRPAIHILAQQTAYSRWLLCSVLGLPTAMDGWKFFREKLLMFPQSVGKKETLANLYTPNAVVELLLHSHCVGANLTAP